MIMQGSTATKLKVKPVDGYACPSGGIFTYVDVLPSHHIQEHQYTRGRILDDPPQPIDAKFREGARL